METSDPKYKHKPSEKHTLEEVLKSLQDLIRNDLAEGSATAGKPGSVPAESRQREGASPGTTETRPRHENPSSIREDFAPASPGSGPVNLDAVMRSLKDLIGNELNVGDEPKPPEAKSAATHEEYLVAGEKIEEYIPEELGQLEDELNIGDEQIPELPEATPPPNDSPAPEEIIEASLPQEFTPLDEELTLEELAEAAPLPPVVPEPDLTGEISPELHGEPAPTTPLDESPTPEEIIEESLPEGFVPLDEELTLEELAEAAPPAPVLSETPELPGEISFEILGEPVATLPVIPKAPIATVVSSQTSELPGEILPVLLGGPETTLPATPEAPVAIKEDLAPGTQHEIFFEEPPAHPREPETAPADSAPAPEPEPALEIAQEPAAKEMRPPAEEIALPTIEVEESFGANDHFDVATPPTESPSAESEEIIMLDAEISIEPEQTSSPADAIPPAAAEPPPAPEPPTAPVKKKLTLEIIEGPISDSPAKTSVDFDSSDLSPPLPEEPELSPNVAGPANEPAPEKPRDTFSVDFDVSDLSPPTPAEPEQPPSETGTAAEDSPAAVTKAEKAPEAKQPPAPMEPAAPSAPESLNLDDIPVLNEVVAPPAGSMPVAKPDVPPPTLPAPDRARDLVVRAVAKLNVEMRKTGGTGLDTKTILRLQQLIRQELEKSGEK